jgi:hypothetical protein
MGPDDRGSADRGRPDLWCPRRQRPPRHTLAPTMAAERGRGDSIILSLVADFALQSSAFDHGGPIPRRHNCEGEHLSPPLAWSGAPEGTCSLALVVDDPDAPAATFTHWLAWALDPGATGLGEGRPPRSRGTTTSARTATAGPARHPATAATATASASTAPLRSLSAARRRQERPATLPRCASEAGLTALRRSGVRRRSAARLSGLDRRRSPRLLRRPATPHGRYARPPAARPAPGASRARAGNRLPVCCGSGAVRPPAPASGAAGRGGRRRCASSLLRSAIASRCHRPTQSARAARQGPAAGATDAERTRGTTTLRVRPVNSESRPRGRLPPDRLSSAPPVRPVRPVTCPADRAPPAAASRPAVPVALSRGFPYRPGTQSLSSQPPATPSLFWGTGGSGGRAGR